MILIRLGKLIWGNKSSRGPIPDQGVCPLSTQLMEDKLRHASGPVQPSIPLHRCEKYNFKGLINLSN